MTIFYYIFKSWFELWAKQPYNGMSTAQMFVLIKGRKTEGSLVAKDKKFGSVYCLNTIQGNATKWSPPL